MMTMTTTNGYCCFYVRMEMSGVGVELARLTSGFHFGARIGASKAALNSRLHFGCSCRKLLQTSHKIILKKHSEFKQK